ncbi:MAG TPA: cytidine deaminase [Halomicronema sp.]
MISDGEREHLFVLARGVLKKAYARYSRFRVGAAILTEAGNFFVGCNVENASYGLTICAERAAICAGVAVEGEGLKLRAVAVVNEQNVPCSPCGGCRQVLWEFGGDALVFFLGKNGVEEWPVSELLPAGFELGEK